MNTFPLLLLTTSLLAVSILAPARAEPASFVLDPEHTQIHFELLHFGTSTIRGRFGPVEGAVTMDPARGQGELSVQLATASISTGVPFFDARIRAADLLDSQAWPKAYFVATRFTFEGEKPMEVRGEFTLRGISQPLSLRALHYACRDDAATGQRLCGGDFEGEILRSDFGSSFGLPFIGDRVRLIVQVLGRR
jgi:polyisoprenoid-binding protein YceI